MSNSWVTKLTEVSSAEKDTLGAIRWEPNGKCYKYVKVLNTTATVAGAIGDAVVYTAEDGYDDNEVCVDASDADSVPIGAGLLSGTITGTAGTAEYAWMQIKGGATANTALAGSPADGQPLSASTTDKTLTLHVDVDAGGDAIQPVAIAVDVTAKTVICNFPF